MAEVEAEPRSRVTVLRGSSLSPDPEPQQSAPSSSAPVGWMHCALSLTRHSHLDGLTTLRHMVLFSLQHFSREICNTCLSFLRRVSLYFDVPGMRRVFIRAGRSAS